MAIEGEGVQLGDRVMVMPGTHNLGRNPVTVAEGIDVRGVPGPVAPKVTSTGPVTLGITNPRASVSDLEITNGGPYSEAFTVVSGRVDRVFAHAHDVGCGVSPFAHTDRPVIRDSFCWGKAQDSGIGMVVGSGGFDADLYTPKLRNVTAVGGLHGLFAGMNRGLDLRLDGENVIAQGLTQEDVVATATDAGTSAIVVLGHSNYAARATTADEGATATVTEPGVGANQTDPPIFRDPSAGDFHQRRSSPTVDAGAGTSLNGPLDIDRQNRWMGAAPDIGGDEIAP